MRITQLSILLVLSVCLIIESKSIKYKSERDLTREILSLSGDSKSASIYTELKSDLVFQISKKLKAADLLDIVRSNSKLACDADDQFYRKYKNHTITIVASDSTRNNKIVECETCIEIFDLQSAADFLKYFGHAIRKLRFRNHAIFTTHANIVNQYMERHGSKYLTHLKLDSIDEDTFQRFTVPFENVEELMFGVNTMTVRRGVHPLSRLFPQLKRLKMELHSNVDYSFIAHTFAHLDEVYISSGMNTTMRQLSHVETFMRKNQQIKTIQIDHFPHDFIKIIKKSLPNVASIALEAVCVRDGAIIQFDSVKQFKLYEKFPGSIEKLSFTRLESLEMEYSEVVSDDWSRFLRRHQNIARLSVTQTDSENDLQLVKLGADLNNLAEVTIECTHISADDIVTFFDTHLNLTKFKVSMTKLFNDTEVKLLQKRFRHNWFVELVRNEPWITFSAERAVLTCME